ncbi:FMN reductase [Thalassotalea loyana]|uniref:FMN reductase n=1 Tax=Thalassotalea loyana TaxID=280483 RepID=A0ABQ6HH53_9GAMM|nr:NAD(P)H-dependent oxidoreductase [Thalassotalea loyana]GLX87417.1 FMN reductase [Thalassotalea loyana]
MKVLAFGATNSANSINKQLAQYAASLVAGAQIEVLDLNDFEMPIYSPEREEQLGQPEQAQRFFKAIGEADAIVISFAEHNGSYTAAYKNLFDWTSRIDMKVFQNKPMLLLSTSPGPGGAGSVLASAVNSAPFFAADVKGSLSIPSFYDNFDVENQRLKNDELKQALSDIAGKLTA